MKRTCATCGRPTTGRTCPVHGNHPRRGAGHGGSWNASRYLASHRRFALAVKNAADWRCEATLPDGTRCPETHGLQAHHLIPGVDDPAYGRCLCRAHHKAVDRQAR